MPTPTWILTLILVAQIQSQTRPIDQKLYDAIHADDPARVETLLNQGADANANQANGWRPILIAAQNRINRTAIVSLLLAHGADVNYRQPDQGWTALAEAAMSVGIPAEIRAHVAKEALARMQAAQAESLKFAAFLLDHGAKIDVPMADGRTPLAMAVQSTNFGMVDLLLSRGANPSTRTTADHSFLRDAELYAEPGFKLTGRTPIFGLATGWDVRIYDRLVSAGADPRAKDDNGWDLLLHSAWNGNIAAVRFFLAHGWSANGTSLQGFTPLMLATRVMGFPDKEMVRLLVANHADPAVRNRFGQTAEELLRLNTDHTLREMRIAALDPESQKYLDAANQTLKWLNPSAKPIGLPRWRLGQSETLDCGGIKLKKIITLDNGQAVLHLTLDPSSEATTLTLSNLSLSDYDAISPAPVVLKTGSRHNVRILFPAIAATPGGLAFDYKVSGANTYGGGSVRQGVDFSPILGEGPYDHGAESYAFENHNPIRTLEIQIDKISVGKKVIPLHANGHVRIAPGSQTLTSAIPPSLKNFVIRYRWRLLPNYRWQTVETDWG